VLYRNVGHILRLGDSDSLSRVHDILLAECIALCRGRSDMSACLSSVRSMIHDNFVHVMKSNIATAS